MTASETISDGVSETVESTELAALFRQLPVEPRCRVCRDEAVCRKVNHMLASGASYAFIVRSLAEDNAKRGERDRVTVDSVRNHCGRHFPVQNVARATYRKILEHRAQENGIDFVNGVATAITPMAFYETVMVKGYETLVDPNTTVDVSTGMIAAGRLQALIESRAGRTSMADILVQVDRIINAVQSAVPEQMWGDIVEKLRRSERDSKALNMRTGTFYDGTDPDEPADVDAEFDAASRLDEEDERRHHEAFLARAEGRRAPNRTIEAPSPAIREFTPKTVKDGDEI
jgi:hypothetical protein